MLYETQVLVALVFLYTIACECAPAAVSRWNANAWSSQLRWNIDREGFDYQGVLYELFHRHPLCRMSHWTLFIDAAAWLAICAANLPVGGQELCVIALIAQTLLFGHKRLTWLAFALYPLLASVGKLAREEQSVYILYISAAIRVAGHGLFEPAPPLIFDGDKPQDKFRTKDGPGLLVFLKYASSSPTKALALLWAPLMGFISELHAGLPFRLLHFATFLLYSKRDSDVRVSCLKRLSNRVYTKGWGSWSVTRRMYSNSGKPATSHE